MKGQNMVRKPSAEALQVRLNQLELEHGNRRARMIEMVDKFRKAALERHEVQMSDQDELTKVNLADELVWQMAGMAHVLLDMQDEINIYYPELVPFLNFLARTYPYIKYKE